MTDEAVSPLRRRMIEDTTIRKFAPPARNHDGSLRAQAEAACHHKFHWLGSLALRGFQLRLQRPPNFAPFIAALEAFATDENRH